MSKEASNKRRDTNSKNVNDDTIITWTKRILFPRIILLLCGLLLCFAALNGVLNPTIISGDAVLAPDGITSIRVDFGGFHLGLALFAFLGVINTSYLKSGLIAMAITLTLVVFTRIIGMNVDGATDAQKATLMNEALPFALSIIGLFILSLKSKN